MNTTETMGDEKVERTVRRWADLVKAKQETVKDVFLIGDGWKCNIRFRANGVRGRPLGFKPRPRSKARIVRRSQR